MIDTLDEGLIAKFLRRGALTAVFTAAFLLSTVASAVADPSYTMAPPIDSTQSAQAVQDGSNAASSTVFTWSEIPQNQDVPLQSATFDLGGYQLYDTAGETIIVPFENQNLYVMKFARSDGDTMYFVNEGDAPVLYVPDGAYLTNATVAGARWYPFPKDFSPPAPVYLGIAPSWNDYVGMGWYSNTYCWGGYYSQNSYFSGGAFVPMFGLLFLIGSHSYHHWDDYRSYCDNHPGWHREDFYDRDVYRFHDNNRGPESEFRGSDNGGYGREGTNQGGSFGDHSGHGSDGVSSSGRLPFRGVTPNRDPGNSGGFRGGDVGNSGGFRGGDVGNSGGFRGGDAGNSGGFRGGDVGNSGGFRGGDAGNSGGFRGADSRGDHSSQVYNGGGTPDSGHQSSEGNRGGSGWTGGSNNRTYQGSTGTNQKVNSGSRVNSNGFHN